MDDDAYQQLKKFALDLLFVGVKDEEKVRIRNFLAEVEKRAASAADADKVLADIVAKSQTLAAAPTALTRWDKMSVFLQSPPFYFLFGFVLLGFAYVSSAFQANTSLTFLMAMLGVALLLYGTGSQAAGTFGSNTAKAAELLQQSKSDSAGQQVDKDKQAVIDVVKAPPSMPLINPTANIAIAGGAAVLTAFFGWSVIANRNEIRQVFRDFDQYQTVRVEFCDGADSECRKSVGASSTTPAAVVVARQASIGATAFDALLKSVRLETSLGEPAFGRKVGNGLEFVVFSNSMSDTGNVRLVLDPPDDTSKLAVKDVEIDDQFFSVASEGCAVTGPTPDSCLLIGRKDSQDGNRVLRYTIKSVVIPSQSVAYSRDGKAFSRTDPLSPI